MQNLVRFRVVPRLPWLEIFLLSPLEIICPRRKPERERQYAPFCTTEMKTCSSYNATIMLRLGRIPWWIRALMICATIPRKR